MMLDWEDVRHFLALTDAGSFSGAARSLRVDHTTVARRVAALESALGLPLIERAPRGVSLTPMGETVARLGVSMADRAAAIARVADDQDAVSGTVRISAPPLMCGHYLAPRMTGLKATHPALVVELVAESRLVSLTRRDADIAIRLARPREDDGALVQRQVAAMGFALYATRDHLAGRDPKDWAFITFAEEFHHLPQQRWLNAYRQGRAEALRTHDLTSQCFAAMAGAGVACLPRFLGDGAPTLVRACDDAPPPREIWLLAHQDLRRAPRVRAALDFLGALFTRDRELLADGTAPGKT